MCIYIYIAQTYFLISWSNFLEKDQANCLTVCSFWVVGGRKIPDHLTKEFIPFRDTTVSRKHFEIDYDNERYDCFR